MDTIILVGHPGSQCIVPASKYLTGKYLSDFDVRYLNYDGEIHGWSQFVADYLKTLAVPTVIFALDDYLVSGFDRTAYDELKKKLTPDVACVKLFHTDNHEHEGYPVTTQYTLWDREFLIALLEQTRTPWDFEIRGSNIFSEFGAKSIYGVPAIEYNTSSCLSSRWHGVRWEGVKQEDLEYIIHNKLCLDI